MHLNAKNTECLFLSKIKEDEEGKERLKKA